MASALPGTRNSSSAGLSASSSNGGAVDTTKWSLYKRDSNRPTPYLVGPIVGAVTASTARVLIEVNAPMLVTMDAYINRAKICSVSKDVRGKTPTAFKLKGLQSGKRVRVIVNAGEFEQEREAMFNVASDKTDWKISTVSCNCHTHVESLKLWDRLVRVIEDVDCVLHLGDQIYADEDFNARQGQSIRFESAWHASLTILDGVAKGDWNSRRAQVLERYRETYRKTWNFPAVASVLASTANYMICDDHEFVDDLGDEPEHCDPSSVEFYVARVAYQVYCEYQVQLLRDIDVTDHTIEPYYALRLSPKVGVFMTENRVERSLHRSNRPEADWKDRTFMGPNQWDRLTQAFDRDFADCETVLLGTPTPLVLVSQGATGFVARIMDDARGSWGHSKFMVEQKALATLLSNWQEAKANRAVVVLGGDVHIGGFTDSWHNGSNVQLHQMTASAVGNTPEKEIDGIKAALMRNVMHADEKLFSFKVRHFDWIFGPNYGMVDIHLNKTSRPDISLTLVPHIGLPNIRNLQLGKSRVNVRNADHSHASRSAHVAAKVMEVPPEGIPASSPSGCNCCTAF